MKIYKWEFTKENTYDFLKAVSVYMVPSSILGTIMQLWFKSPELTAAFCTAANAVIYFVELLLKPTREKTTY